MEPSDQWKIPTHVGRVPIIQIAVSGGVYEHTYQLDYPADKCKHADTFIEGEFAFFCIDHACMNNAVRVVACLRQKQGDNWKRVRFPRHDVDHWVGHAKGLCGAFKHCVSNIKHHLQSEYYSEPDIGCLSHLLDDWGSRRHLLLPWSQLPFEKRPIPEHLFAEIVEFL